MAALREELARAVDQVLATDDRSVQPVGHARLAVAEADGDTVVFYVEQGRRNFTEEALESAFLAESKSEKPYPVYVEPTGDGRFRVKASPAAAELDTPQLYLRLKASKVHEPLPKRILAAQDGLALALATGQLTPAARPVTAAGLNGPQCAALADMMQAGVNAVWGPPGTGKTQVIAAFLEWALRAGKSVLLTSHTNVAVDNALTRLLATSRVVLEPGQLVRHGPPGKIAAEVVAHPFLLPDKAAAVRTGREALLRQITEEEAALRAQDRGKEIYELRRELDHFDARDFARYERLAPTLDRLIQREAELASAEQTLQHITGVALPGVSLPGVDSAALAGHVDELRAEIARLEQGVDGLDRGWYTLARSHGWPEKFRRHRELSDAARSNAQASRTLKDRRRELEDTLRQSEAYVRATCQVLVTTLSGFLGREELAKRTFDYVVVDEAAATWPAQVLVAAMRARVGLSMIGDFYQNGPITQVVDLQVHPLNRCTTFELVGVSEAADALQRNTQGLVALEQQHRFGPAVTRLVNDSTYAGLLKVAPGRTAELTPRREITVVDSGPMGELAVTRQPRYGTGWWSPLGAYVTLELAKRYAAADATAGRRLGVVTPYRCQADLVAAALREAALPEVTADTTHRMQGDERDDVIFDLVEARNRDGWMTQDSIEALRVFTVGVTRTRGRLLVVADVQHVLRQSKGPLVALRGLLEASEVAVFNPELMLRRLPDSATLTAALAGLDGDLRSLVRDYWERGGVQTFFDGPEFVAALPAVLAAAESEVRLWSPFLTARGVATWLPHLAAANERGAAVTVYTKAAGEVRDGRTNTADLYQQLRAARLQVVEVRGMHQKGLVVDRCAAYYGSLNVLSFNGGTGEIMTHMAGPQVGKLLLRLEGVEQPTQLLLPRS